MKFYLIGAALPNPLVNLAQFNQAQKELEAHGHTVENIMYHAGWHEFEPQRCIAYRLALMLKCEAVFVLPGWQEDGVSELEFIVAINARLSLYKAIQTIIPGAIKFGNFPFRYL